MDLPLIARGILTFERAEPCKVPGRIVVIEKRPKQCFHVQTVSDVNTWVSGLVSASEVRTSHNFQAQRTPGVALQGGAARATGEAGHLGCS
jgi:hypothetical protein